jgi:subtilase family serine protease
VTNNGSATAASSIIYLGENNALAGEQTVPSLEAGQSTTITFNWIPTKVGTLNLQARVDATYVITESDETKIYSPINQVTVT